MSSGIIKVKKHEKDYFTVLNAPFNDGELSFGARGILAYLLSKPDDWQVMNEDLYNQSPASRTAVDRMMKELKDNGYIRRYRESDHKGHLFWVTEVYEDRTENPEWNSDDQSDGHYPKERFPTVGKPERRKTRQSVNPIVENPTVGKPDDILNTDSNKGLNKQITDNNTTPTTAHVCDDEFSACIAVLSQRGLFLDSFTSQLVQDCFDDIDPQGDETKLDWFTYAVAESAGTRPNWKYLDKVIRAVNDSGGLSAHSANRQPKSKQGYTKAPSTVNQLVKDRAKHTQVQGLF